MLFLTLVWAGRERSALRMNDGTQLTAFEEEASALVSVSFTLRARGCETFIKSRNEPRTRALSLACLSLHK